MLVYRLRPVIEDAVTRLVFTVPDVMLLAVINALGAEIFPPIVRPFCRVRLVP